MLWTMNTLFEIANYLAQNSVFHKILQSVGAGSTTEKKKSDLRPIYCSISTVAHNTFISSSRNHHTINYAIQNLYATLGFWPHKSFPPELDERLNLCAGNGQPTS